MTSTTVKFEKEENIDAFVASLRIPEEGKLAFKQTPTSETLTKHDDDRFTLIINIPNKELKTTFTPGVEYELVNEDGKSVKTTFTFDDKSLVQKMWADGSNEAVFVKRQLSEEANTHKVLYSTNYADAVATRYFKRV